MSKKEYKQIYDETNLSCHTNHYFHLCHQIILHTWDACNFKLKTKNLLTHQSDFEITFVKLNCGKSELANN